MKEFFGNYMLISAAIGWISAQIIKMLTAFIVKKEFDIKFLFTNGGMPSSHSATVLALCTSAGIYCGVGSPEFAICGVLAIIVMNDAFGVRLEAGKQATVINRITKELFSGKAEFNTKLKELIGHTPLQVFMGALLGVAVAVIYAFILKWTTGTFPVR